MQRKADRDPEPFRQISDAFLQLVGVPARSKQRRQILHLLKKAMNE